MPIALVLILWLLPNFAAAGAWPQDKGRLFASFSQELSWPDAGTDAGAGAAHLTHSLYLEYGLTGSLTVGARGWHDPTNGGDELLLFARHPLGSNDTHRFAVELGLGARRTAGGPLYPVIQPGVAWGRGFDSRFGPGWISVEALVGGTIGTADTWAKTELTIGLKPTDRDMVILHLRAEADRNLRAVTLAPAYVRRLGRGFSVELGATWRITGTQRRGLTASTWIEF